MCGCAHVCTGGCHKWHTCNSKRCGRHFARAEPNLVSNPLARFLDLAMSVKLDDAVVVEHDRV